MVDSHALVGSCAQIGKRVHLSAAAQIGGVLEPAGARPVVVEDDAFVGGLVGLFEGIVVRKRAVLASGVVITGSTVIYDLVHSRELRQEVPEGAVVVPGSRPASGDFARARGLQVAAPCIVKYRDDRTDAATALEEALRMKEQHGGEVIVASAGPARVQQVLREALARGADRALHVESDALAYADAFTVADALAAAICYANLKRTRNIARAVATGPG